MHKGRYIFGGINKNGSEEEPHVIVEGGNGKGEGGEIEYNRLLQEYLTIFSNPFFVAMYAAGNANQNKQFSVTQFIRKQKLNIIIVVKIIL